MPHASRRVLLGCIGLPILLFLLIQLVPVWLAQTNPPVTSEPPWPNPGTRELVRRACFDCHSNETQWPLYARIAPGSWLVTYDVIRGRNHLNFSQWNERRAGGQAERGERGGRERGGDVAELVRNGDMPPWYYLILHPEARLSTAEQEDLIQGLQSVMGTR